MAPIHSWHDFMRAIRRYLLEDNPLRGLRAHGGDLDGEVADAFARGSRDQAGADHTVARMRAAYGPLPRVRLHTGRAPRPRPSQLAASGYGAMATVDLSVLNEVLTELHRVRTIPHELTAEQTALVINLDTFRRLCTGLPDDADLGVIKFTGPPVASASRVSQLNLHLAIECVIQFPSQTASPLFIGVIDLEVPLQFLVKSAVVSYDPLSAVTASLTLGAFANVRPRSEQAHRQLEALIQSKIRSALLVLALQHRMEFTASIPVHRSRFPNSTIDVVQVGAVTIRQNGRDYAVIGFNVENERDTAPIELAGQPLPVAPHNIHTEIDAGFAADALDAIITSGDLGAFLSRVFKRNVADYRIDVNDGRVSFGADELTLVLDCVVRHFCPLTTDLGFTATVTGRPAIDKGTLTIATSDVDLNLDNVDAIVCGVSGAAFGPIAIVVWVAAMAIAASYNPSSSDLNIPVSETSNPLPGSDKVVDLELTTAALSPALSPGMLTADGRLQVINDPVRIFAYLRVVEQLLPRETEPVDGATVELYELDYPVPPGDDVVDPSYYVETATAVLLTTDEVTYSPRADELLGVGTTGPDGRVTFVVIANTIGGSATRNLVQENLRTGRVTTNTSNFLVGERLPDLGVTIRSAAGKLLAQRRIVGLDVVNNRLGRFNQPVDITVRRDRVGLP